MIKRALLFVLVAMLFSCSNQQEKELRESVSKISNNDYRDAKALKGATLSQYKDQEKRLTDNYIKGLKDIIDKNFDNQIEEFEDNELGVIAGYKYMFKYIFSSEQEWNDLQLQLTDRYFNSISLQQKAYEYSEDYLNRIKELRSQFYKDKSGVTTPKIEVLQIPKNQVFIGDLGKHSGTNLAIEIGTTILDVLLGLLLAWIVVNIFGYAKKGLVGCLVTIISFIIIMIISVICTSHNDGKLIDSLKSQHESITIDYGKLQKSLDNNSTYFYDSLK